MKSNYPTAKGWILLTFVSLILLILVLQAKMYASKEGNGTTDKSLEVILRWEVHEQVKSCY